MRRILALCALAATLCVVPAGPAYPVDESCSKALDAADRLLALQNATVRDASAFSAEVSRLVAKHPASVFSDILAAQREMQSNVAVRQSDVERAAKRYAKYAKDCERS